MSDSRVGVSAHGLGGGGEARHAGLRCYILSRYSSVHPCGHPRSCSPARSRSRSPQSLKGQKCEANGSRPAGGALQGILCPWGCWLDPCP
eukprot:1940573-Pyramimonas_sp.AAC.1